MGCVVVITGMATRMCHNLLAIISPAPSSKDRVVSCIIEFLGIHCINIRATFPVPYFKLL